MEQDPWVGDQGQEEAGGWGAARVEDVWGVIVPELVPAATVYALPAEPKHHTR